MEIWLDLGHVHAKLKTSAKVEWVVVFHILVMYRSIGLQLPSSREWQKFSNTAREKK